jgi:RNA polymerase sigma-70 factor (family 1)
MDAFASETDLLQSFRLGQPAAYRHIYSLYMRQLCFFVEQVTGDTITSEDIVAEAFIATFNKKENFADLNKVKAFLFVSAGNSAKNYLKSKQRHDAVHTRIEKESDTRSESPELAYLRSEALQAIREEIEKLPEPTRKVISQSFIEGKSISEIADDLNLAYKTVQNQKTRGIKMLRSALLRNNLLSAPILCLALNLLESSR